jgi:hypothetical protein
MLHLIPLRPFLIVFAIVIILAVFLAGYGPLLTMGDMAGLVRLASSLALLFLLAASLAWRWVPAIQTLVFPYLGGSWDGQLSYEGTHGSGQVDVKLDVTHNLFYLRLILDSEQSTSKTLVVHADHSLELKRDRLYYVFLNERKEGLPGRRDQYRGLATLRVDAANNLRLIGEYFTERQGHGTLTLSRTRPHPWWSLLK